MSNTTERFEKPTDELRQVTRIISLHEPSFFGPSAEKMASQNVTVVTAVQRKHLIQDGPDHFDEIPDRSRPFEWLPDVPNPDPISEAHARVISAYPVYSDRGDGRLGRFCYVKDEWRDLPSVSRRETNQSTNE